MQNPFSGGYGNGMLKEDAVVNKLKQDAQKRQFSLLQPNR